MANEVPDFSHLPVTMRRCLPAKVVLVRQNNCSVES